MNTTSKIYVAGHRGMIGSAFIRCLKKGGYENLVVRSHDELELTRQNDVRDFFYVEKPDVVIDAAAMVGGIKANSERMAEFYYHNTQIQQNLIWSSFQSGVREFLFLGSACMYPKECEQPMKEIDILSGKPEITNEGYALAKIGGARLCNYLSSQYGLKYLSVIPANAYGINDQFDSNNSHVIPALINKIYNAKKNNIDSVVLWGTGKALREFINADDLADACLFLLKHYAGNEPINIGTGEEISILELAYLIKDVIGYTGQIKTDPSKPDGMMRRLCDTSKLFGLGWRPSITLKDGIEKEYNYYLDKVIKQL